MITFRFFWIPEGFGPKTSGQTLERQRIYGTCLWTAGARSQYKQARLAVQTTYDPAWPDHVPLCPVTGRIVTLRKNNDEGALQPPVLVAHVHQ